MGIESNTAGDHPQIDPEAFVHPSAVIIGNVLIGRKVYVGPHVSIRADEPGPDGKVAPITIEKESNVQDGAIVHAFGGTCVTVGQGTSIAHGAVLHGPCSIGSGCFVGFNSVVCNASLGNNVVIMHCVMVDGVSVQDGLFVPSRMAVCLPEDVALLRPASEDDAALAARVRLINIRFAEAQIRV